MALAGRVRRSPTASRWARSLEEARIARHRSRSKPPTKKELSSAILNRPTSRSRWKAFVKRSISAKAPDQARHTEEGRNATGWIPAMYSKEPAATVKAERAHAETILR